MKWFKEHVDSVVVIGIMFSGFLWMNGKFNDIDQKFYESDRRNNERFMESDRKNNERFTELDRSIFSVENRLTKIETVLIIKGIYPTEIYGSVEK